MPEALQRECIQLKDDSKGPLWQYASIAIIAIIIGFILYSGNKEDDARRQYLISSVKAGDVYDHKLESGDYTSFKVIEISGDSLSIQRNEHTVTSKKQLQDINKVENFNQASEKIAKRELYKMYASKEIVEINRSIKRANSK